MFAALVLAWNPVGLGDTLTGVFLGAVGLVVLVVAWFFVSEWLESRSIDYHQRGPRRLKSNVSRGVLICDWVDTNALQTIAKQMKVAPAPVRMEQGENVKLAGALESRRLRLGRDKTRDKKEIFELSADHNDLLVKVLEKLDEEESLLTDLDETWTSDGSVLSGDKLDDLIRAAQDSPQLEAARAAVQALQTNVLREDKSRNWAHSAQVPRFALVENQWTVEQVGEDVVLRLQSLRMASYAPGPIYGNPSEHAIFIDLPEGLSLTVALPNGRLTEQAEGRFMPGSKIRAGVFGRTGTFDLETGHLPLNPVAVFTRVESGPTSLGC